MTAERTPKESPTATMHEQTRLESSNGAVSAGSLLNLPHRGVGRGVQKNLLEALQMEITAMRALGSNFFWEVISLSVSLRACLSLTVFPRVLGYSFGSACC